MICIIKSSNVDATTALPFVFVGGLALLAGLIVLLSLRRSRALRQSAAELEGHPGISHALDLIDQADRRVLLAPGAAEALRSFTNDLR